MKNNVLIIAGSDSCAGAGVQADLKTASAFKTYAATAITCLTAQNTVGVNCIFYAQPDFVKKQIAAVFDDLKIDAIKIGMLGNQEIALSVAKILQDRASNIALILDPVMIATSGDSLLTKPAIEVIRKKLLPLAYLVTPNIPEAELLSGLKIKDLKDMENAALKIIAMGAKNVLIKGGHLNLDDVHKIYSLLLSFDSRRKIITNKKLPVGPIHGTGCTLASAITCLIAKGYDLPSAVSSANRFTYHAIKNGIKMGRGSRILNHFLTNKKSSIN